MKNTILLSIDALNPNRQLLKYGVFTAKNLKATLLLFDAKFQSVIIPNDYVTPSNTVVQVIDQGQQIEKAKKISLNYTTNYPKNGN
ncbi:MAG: hypothetical protein AAF960_04775 [Bacteroidota bacterium]